MLHGQSLPSHVAVDVRHFGTVPKSRAECPVVRSPHRLLSEYIMVLLFTVCTLTPHGFRLAVDTDYQRPQLSSLLLDDSELSELLIQGKQPLAGKPPKPPSDVLVPKIKAEPAQGKIKLKTGAFKPKSKVRMVIFVMRPFISWRSST